jgi:6-phosphogluconolactonase
MLPRSNPTTRAALAAFALALAGGAAGLPAPAAEPRKEGKMDRLMVYVGTYTRPGGSKGIYRFEMDPATGKLTSAGAPAECVSPSFLAIHPNHRFLYAVDEISDFQGQKAGAISAFAIDPTTGALTHLNQASSKGDGPCHLVVDRSGKVVLVANYGGGSVAALPIRADGRVGEATSFIQHAGPVADPQRQGGPHGHSINVDAANRFAFAADLGLDKILVYRLDPEKGTLTPNNPPYAEIAPRSGPRHFAFHPSGRFAYVINEISLTVTAFAYDPATGTLRTLQTVPTVPPGDHKGYSTAEVQVHPSGKFLYGSNRGHDSIAMFRIDPNTGMLSPLGTQPSGGKTPRNFGIDPSGKFLLAAHQDSNDIVVFRIDAESGKLTPTGERVEVPMPVCVKFLPLAR